MVTTIMMTIKTIILKIVTVIIIMKKQTSVIPNFDFSLVFSALRVFYYQE